MKQFICAAGKMLIGPIRHNNYPEYTREYAKIIEQCRKEKQGAGKKAQDQEKAMKKEIYENNPAALRHDIRFAGSCGQGVILASVIMAQTADLNIKALEAGIRLLRDAQ